MTTCQVVSAVLLAWTVVPSPVSSSSTPMASPT
jgi:hypothetical protein